MAAYLLSCVDLTIIELHSTAGRLECSILANGSFDDAVCVDYERADEFQDCTTQVWKMSEAESRSDNSNRLRIISPIVGAFILYNVLSFATLLLEVPLVRLFERSICNRHYQGSDTIPDVGGDVDESLCKVAAVQDKLATVVGWQLAFGALAGDHISSFFLIQAHQASRTPDCSTLRQARRSEGKKTCAFPIYVWDHAHVSMGSHHMSVRSQS